MNRDWQLSGLALLCIVAVTAPIERAQAQTATANEFDCVILPKMTLKIGTPVPGLISEVLVDRGAILKKGDVIARLESHVEEATVALATARAENDASVRTGRHKSEYQKRKEERVRQLRKNDNIALSAADEAETTARISEIELEEAQTNLRIAQLELSRAAELLRQRTIRSPVDGVVVARTLGPGEYAFDQAHLVTIAQIHPLHVEVFLPLKEFARVRVGTRAEVLPEEPVGGRHQATVTVVDQVLDAASGTIGLRLELPNPDYALPSGLKCRVRFPGVG